jgi:16S rRNA (guanine527-N7)-methyltransferase
MGYVSSERCDVKSVGRVPVVHDATSGNKGSKVVLHKGNEGYKPGVALGPGVAETAAMARELGMALDESQASQLATYLGLLSRWNKAMNLVGPRHWRDIMRELVTDSMHLADVLREAPLPEEPLVLDLGAGAGIPGIPLRILWPRGEYRLVERRGKRALFLGWVLAAVPLGGTSVFEGDAEDILADNRADVVVSRAFLPWRELLCLVEGRLADAALVLVMGKELPPAQLPEGWRCLTVRGYRAAGKERFIWVLRSEGGA